MCLTSSRVIPTLKDEADVCTLRRCMRSVCLGQMSCLQLAFLLFFFSHLREQNVNNCGIEVGSAIIL